MIVRSVIRADEGRRAAARAALCVFVAFCSKLVGCAVEPHDSAGSDTGSTDTAGPAWACGPYSPQTVLWQPPGEVSYRSRFLLDSEVLGAGDFYFEGLGTTDFRGMETWVHVGRGDTLDNTGTRHEWTLTTWYLCDEVGLQQVHVEQSQTLTDATGSVSSTTSVREYSEFPLVYPADLGLGSVWTYHGVFVETHSEGLVVEGETTVERRAPTEESVEVPAGSFTALHIEMESEEGTVSNLYSASGTGVVLTDDMQLVSHETFPQ